MSRDNARISGELFTLTYGSLVTQLLEDYEHVDEVNVQLEKMGFNIGQRLIDEFLAANMQIAKCQDFTETANVVARSGFKMFLGITPQVTNWSADGKECSLVLDDNPLTVFTELPEHLHGLRYSNLLCGVLRGALAQVQMRVEVRFARDALLGDDATELRLRLVEMLEDEAPPDND